MVMKEETRVSQVYKEQAEKLRKQILSSLKTLRDEIDSAIECYEAGGNWGGPIASQQAQRIDEHEARHRQLLQCLGLYAAYCDMPPKDNEDNNEGEQDGDEI